MSHKMVRVIWLDAWGSCEPHSLTKIKEAELHKVESVAHLIEETESCVKIAMDFHGKNTHGVMSKEDQYDYFSIIPKACVLEIKELKEAE